ncbi:MAG: PLP-dependent aminotransferase family protein [Hyphomicrobiales bacterium]|nr:PLP-dependent aminotransferase family protein [Hyphomicrobiales bacterium]MDE2017353.1 PLP-dependent aminotransferase family protein [Hyphomicrobiales bacterium]
MVQGPVRMAITRIGQVMATISGRIAGRALAPGEKLPSVRGLARTMRVSVSTVVEAYDRLVNDGDIVSRPGSGFYVAGRTVPLALSEVGPRIERTVDPLWVSRQSLEADERALKPGCGWLPRSWLPRGGMRRALRELSRADDAVLFDYASPLGLPPLRRLIVRRIAERGIEASPDQVMLTESGTQAMDLICRLLLSPGDAVLIDDPCYFNFQALLRAHRARAVSVPYAPDGPDVRSFAAAMAEHRPRLYITNSAVHNPTGATLSPVVAHRVLKLADQYATVIVEDDIFADFELAPAPRLAAFDGLDRVIHVGSFSKTLSAAARCGFIAAKPEWIEGLIDLKIATSFGGGALDAELVLAALAGRGYRKHLEGLRDRLARARSDVAVRLKGLGIEPWLEPQAGMFLWCLLPDGLDAADIAKTALAENVVLAPGNVFSLAQTATGYLRFNVSQSTDERMYTVLRSAMRRRPPIRSRGTTASAESRDRQ